jgi:hypothetical protein
MTWWRTSRRVRGRARTVRGVPQTKCPRGVSFLEREKEREREREREEEDLGRVGEEKEALLHLHPAAWDPPVRGTRGQPAVPSRTVRVVRGRFATPARTVRYLLQNDQCCTSSPRASRTVRAALADNPPVAAGQPGPLSRTVRPPFSILA